MQVVPEKSLTCSITVSTRLLIISWTRTYTFAAINIGCVSPLRTSLGLNSTLRYILGFTASQHPPAAHYLNITTRLGWQRNPYAPTVRICSMRPFQWSANPYAMVRRVAYQQMVLCRSIIPRNLCYFDTLFHPHPHVCFLNSAFCNSLKDFGLQKKEIESLYEDDIILCYNLPIHSVDSILGGQSGGTSRKKQRLLYRSTTKG